MASSDDADRTYTSATSSGHDEQLNRTTVHDSGIYDPSDTEDRIVLMYDTLQAAAAAHKKLEAMGVPGTRAQVMSHTPDGIDAGTDYEGGEHGLWSAIKSLFMSDDHAHGYAEGVRRGHALLVVHPAPSHRLEAVRLLETTGPIDFDARLEEWRSAGWDNLAAAAKQASPASEQPASMTVYDTATRTSHVETSPAATQQTKPAAGSHPVDYPTIGNTTSKPQPPSF